MELQFKQRVTEELNKWLEESPDNRTLNGLAEEHGITKLYLSRIKNGIYAIDHTSGKSTEIADEYFHRIAYAIGLTTRSRTGLHWETANFTKIQKAARAAQNKRMRILLDADTGFGKTYALEHYSLQKDRVMYLKVTRSMTERDLLNAILKKLGNKDLIRGNRQKLNTIRHILTGTPGWLFIIDEAEYMRPALFHVIKEIADFTEQKCGFIMAGMGVTNLINKLADRKRLGFPQLRRRFFPNRLLLPERIENSEKKMIANSAGITDSTAINVICQYCNDFDMLSQMIQEAIDWQKQKGRKITGQELLDLYGNSLEM